MNAKVRGKTSGTIQKSDREVDADDLRAKVRQGERMPPVATADVRNARGWCELKQVPKRTGFVPNMA